MTISNTTQIECDYLVVGCGAVAMSFVDTLLDESDATVVMVDNHHQPGGHWNDAYPFVRLHQPSHFYGVASTPLGTKSIDSTGSNAGYFELASGTEVQSYFERIMRQRFLPTGRVQYFPMSEYLGEKKFRNVLSNETHEVVVKKRVVDSTYFKTSVPSRHTKNYDVSPGIKCIAPNSLPSEAVSYSSFCIIGAGKTAMDANVWLLDNKVPAKNISWVCPRTSWLMNREVTQASIEFFKESIGGFALQMEAIANASSQEDLFNRLEECGFMLRIDVSQRPEMFHFATISKGEVEQLRRIENVIQQGRVKSIGAEGLEMADGSKVSLSPDTLYVDCTASAVDFTSTKKCPVFEGDKITIQMVRAPNPCLSAAITAFVESNYDSDDVRNKLCQPVPLPDNETGWMRSTLGNMMNQGIWSTEPNLSNWIANCRLDGFGSVIREADMSDPENVAILEKMGQNSMPAVANLQKLLS